MSPLIRACRRSAFGGGQPNPRETNLRATYEWLCAAQDATPDGGVAGWYHLLRGWAASYPEPTGYIIPTFLAYSSALSEPDARDRALRMAEWEIEVQLSDGAVRSGVLGARTGPSVFNTGQALFGWLAAYRATGEERYRQASQRAAEWLMKNQDSDGAWRRNLSLLTTSAVQTYNIRAGWGLALAGRAFDEPAWMKAAARNCEWTLTQQTQSGWFANNGFYENEVPLLHTIAYTLEGLSGVGETLADERCVDAARSGVRPLWEIYQTHRALKGRYDPNWNSPVSWRCLTGEAQLAAALLRLSKYFGDDSFSQMARSLLEGLAAAQDTDGPFPESRGGIAGSEPIWGGYCPLTYVNWGAKFFLDALLMELRGTDVREFHR